MVFIAFFAISFCSKIPIYSLSLLFSLSAVSYRMKFTTTFHSLSLSLRFSLFNSLSLWFSLFHLSCCLPFCSTKHCLSARPPTCLSISVPVCLAICLPVCLCSCRRLEYSYKQAQNAVYILFVRDFFKCISNYFRTCIHLIGTALITMIQTYMKSISLEQIDLRTRFVTKTKCWLS